MSAPNEITERVLNWIRRERLDRQAARIAPHQVRGWVETRLVGSLDRETGQEFTNPHYESEHSDALKAAARLGLKHVDWRWIRQELYSRITGAISLKEQDVSVPNRESLDFLRPGEPCWWEWRASKPEARLPGRILDVRATTDGRIRYAVYMIHITAESALHTDRVLMLGPDVVAHRVGAHGDADVIPGDKLAERPDGWASLKRIPDVSLEPTHDPSVRPTHEMAGDMTPVTDGPSPEAITARERKRTTLVTMVSGDPCWWNPKLPKDPNMPHQAGWVLDVRRDADGAVWYVLYMVERAAGRHVLLTKGEDTTPREALTVRHVIPERYHQVRPVPWHDLERIPGASLEPTVDPSVRPVHEMAGDAAGAPGEPSPEAIAARERKRAQVEWDDRMAALNRGLFGPLGLKWKPPNLWQGARGPMGRFEIQVKPPTNTDDARIVWRWIPPNGIPVGLGETSLLNWAHGFLLCTVQAQVTSRLGGASNG